MHRLLWCGPKFACCAQTNWTKHSRVQNKRSEWPRCENAMKTFRRQWAVCKWQDEIYGPFPLQGWIVPSWCSASCSIPLKPDSLFLIHDGEWIPNSRSSLVRLCAEGEICGEICGTPHNSLPDTSYNLHVLMEQERVSLVEPLKTWKTLKYRMIPVWLLPRKPC